MSGYPTGKLHRHRYEDDQGRYIVKHRHVNGHKSHEHNQRDPMDVKYAKLIEVK